MGPTLKKPLMIASQTQPGTGANNSNTKIVLQAKRMAVYYIKYGIFNEMRQSVDFLLSIAVFSVVLIFSVFKNISILIPMVFGLLCFSATAMYRGFHWMHVIKMVARGFKKSLIVIRIFVLIGLITAMWRACGTIPFFVYYGTQLIYPQFFILFSFLLSCMVSLSIGTSFGTASTIGVVLIVLAQSGQVNLNITAGAIIAGAYFGDRCAPTSSSANLVATLTNTHLYDNIKNMFKTAAIPFIVSVLIYSFFSLQNPMLAGGSSILSEISGNFNLSPFVMLPALIILVLSIMKYDVKLSMLLSVISGAAICLWVQHIPLADVLRYMLLGYTLPAGGSFAKIIAGGGLISMVKVVFIVLIASAYSGIFEEADLFHDIQPFLEKLSRRIALFPTMVITSITTSAFSCNQTLAIILTHQLLHQTYTDNGYSNEELAIDIENSVVLIAALIPWSIAVAVPIATLSADIGCIPYAVFLYLVPLTILFQKSKHFMTPVRIIFKWN